MSTTQMADEGVDPGSAASARQLVHHAAGALATHLPPAVEERATLHVLDAIAAMVSGAQLPAGQAGRAFCASSGAQGSCVVVGSSRTVDAERAALANGMSAHADETDDSHEPSTTHPGCAVVPAALAAAQIGERSGRELLRAVSLGYDVGTRLPIAIGADAFDLTTSALASHAFGPMFGSAYAAGSLLGSDADDFTALTSYAAQELSGLSTWLHDKEHVLKAYVFGGMPASTGVRLAVMVRAGWPGGGDVVHHPRRTMLRAFAGPRADPTRLVEGLGQRYAIAETNLKRYAVGSPIQAVIQALDHLLAEHRFGPEDVDQVRVHLHPRLADVVDRSLMPAVNCQYCVAVTIEDGALTYAAAHDGGRMLHPRTNSLMDRITVLRDRPDPVVREAVVDVVLADGRVLSRHEDAVLGTVQRPLTPRQTRDKAEELMEPALGAQSARQVADLTLGLADLPGLGPLLHLLAGRD